MAVDHQDAVGDQTSTSGINDFVIDGVALVGCVSFASALTDGKTYNYRCQNDANSEWEVGQGVWTSATSTLTRTTIFRSSNGGAKTNFSAGLKAVAIVAVAADLFEISTITHAATSKDTPVDADELPLVDSAALNGLKKLTWANLKATIKSYFDTIYQVLLVSGTNIKTINGTSLLGSGNISVSASPGGADTNVQFNDGGAFGGSPNFTYDKTTNKLTLLSKIVIGGTFPGIYDNGLGKAFVTVSDGGSNPIVTLSANSYDMKLQGGKFALSDSLKIGWGDVMFARNAAGVAEVNNGTSGTFRDLKLRGLSFGATFTVATLPSATSSDGLVYRVSDANSPAIGSAVSGGGSSKCTVQSNGTNWNVIWI